jgi:hypothetical protein
LITDLAGITRLVVSRRDLLLAALYARFQSSVVNPRLEVRRDGDRLRVRAPQLRFLTGKPLERLQNGAPVTFAIQLTLSTDPKAAVLARAIEQFVTSYDLWEEKFSVTRLGSPPRAVSHLAPKAAESWCIDNVSVPVAGLAAWQPFWIRLELRTEDPKERFASQDGQGLTLSRLIDLFSRPARDRQFHLVEEAGPLRLADLKQ